MTDETKAVALRPQMAVGEALSVQEILAQKALIQNAMKAAMKDGQHYGKIPGCGDKPSLLQPGAQTILLLFRMCPDYGVETIDMPNGHRECRVICRLTSSSGAFLGSGVGSCSTMEAKYRFRPGPSTLTDKPVPREYWDLRTKDPKKAQELLGGPGYAPKKNDDGMWFIAQRSSARVEHDNPADHYNTVLKMAKKRALVDATLTRTAASDIFTQDLEDLKANLDAYEGRETAPETPEGGAAGPSNGAKKPETPPPSSHPPAEKTRPGGSQGPSPAKKAPETAEERKKRWIDLCVQAGGGGAHGVSYATDYYRSRQSHGILPNEELIDLKAEDLPKTKEEANAILTEIAKLSGAADGPDPDDPNSPNAPWRSFPVPFGKDAGTKLGDLDKKKLFGWWANYEVETTFQGKAKKPETIAKDQKFRDMLDAAGVHYEFSKPEDKAGEAAPADDPGDDVPY